MRTVTKGETTVPAAGKSSILTPVSLKKGTQHAPRLSPARMPGRRDERFWTEEELAIVRKYYPLGGAAPCLAHLGVHRTASGIYQQAAKLDLRCPKGKRGAERFVPPRDMDVEIREGWEQLDGKKRGAVNAFADRLGVPRWWLSRQIVRLGLSIPHKKEPMWTEGELALLDTVPLHMPDKCVKIFREHGFNRSATAIVVQAKRRGLSRRGSRATYTGTEVSKLLGLDNKTVTGWCITGDLPATRRGTKRLPQQGGDMWDIEPSALRQFILDNLERIDLRKVEKFAFVHVLTTADS